MEKLNKKNIILLGTGKLSLELADQIVKSKNLNLLGIIKENSKDNAGKFKKYDLGSNIKLLKKTNADVCIAADYHRFIPDEIVKSVKIINSHGGILPENRGYHASGWGFINGDKELGYSLHLMDEELDNGPVIYIFKYKVNPKTDFNDVKKAIYEDQKKNVLKIVAGYLNGNIMEKPQKIKFPKYYAKRNLSDCYIDWSRSSEYLENFIRALSIPSGPGAFTVFKNKKLIILKSEFYNCEDYVEVPGHVVFKKNGKVLVKTGDKCLWIEDVIYGNKKMKAGEVIKITGYRLGINLLEDTLKLKKIIS